MTSRTSNIIVLMAVGSFIIIRTIFPPASNDNLSNTLLTLSFEIAGAILLYGLLKLLENIKQLWFFFLTKFYFRKTEIRLSLAYLYRINVNGNYLLVKSRIRNTFQPVGGAFKTLPGSEKVFKRLNVRPDRIIETQHGIAKGDLRVHVKGENVIEFLDWFHSKEDRETSPWREFCEELITPGILRYPEFRFIDYKYQGLVQSPIITLDSGEKGLFVFEIYDLIINDEQRPILENLLKAGNTDKYIWADDYLIQRLGHDERTKSHLYDISPHTKYAQNMKWKMA